MDWTDFTAGQFRQLASFTQADLAEIVPFTITRTVGLLMTSIDFDPILNQDYSGAAGFAVCNERARATLATPFPFTAAGDDTFFYHQFFADQLESGGGGDQLMTKVWTIDSKAQRKVEDGQGIAFNCQGGGSSDGFDVFLAVRMLCKLH